MIDENVRICPYCDGRGVILDKNCANIDCNEGILKTKKEIINELEKEKSVSQDEKSES